MILMATNDSCWGGHFDGKQYPNMVHRIANGGTGATTAWCLTNLGRHL